MQTASALHWWTCKSSVASHPGVVALVACVIADRYSPVAGLAEWLGSGSGPASIAAGSMHHSQVAVPRSITRRARHGLASYRRR